MVRSSKINPLGYPTCEYFEVAVVVRIPFVWPGVGGNEDSFRCKVYMSALDFYLTGIAVRESQESVPFDPGVEIVDDDIGVAVITIPPFSSLFEVGARGLLLAVFGFAEVRVSPNDDNICFEVTWGREDMAYVGNGFVISHVSGRVLLEDLSVLFAFFHGVVEFDEVVAFPRFLGSKVAIFPGAVDTAVGLHAIIAGFVAASTAWFQVSCGEHLLHRAEDGGFRKLYISLVMRSFVLSLLELPNGVTDGRVRGEVQWGGRVVDRKAPSSVS